MVQEVSYTGLDVHDLTEQVRRLTETLQARDEEVDRETARADMNADAAKSWRKEAKNLETEVESWRAAYREVLAELKAADLEVEQLEDDLNDVQAGFDRYREYTQAGFATLYHERKFGPTPGAPGTERNLSDYQGYVDGEYVRVVTYPVENRLVIDSGRRFGKSEEAAEGWNPQPPKAPEEWVTVPRRTGHAQGTLTFPDEAEFSRAGIVGFRTWMDGEMIHEEYFDRPQTWPLQEDSLPFELQFKAHLTRFARPAEELWAGISSPLNPARRG